MPPPLLLAKELRPDGFRVNSVDPGYTATDLNDHRGHRHMAQAASVVVGCALRGADGSTGSFFTGDGIVPW